MSIDEVLSSSAVSSDECNDESSSENISSIKVVEPLDDVSKDEDLLIDLLQESPDIRAEFNKSEDKICLLYHENI